MKKIGFIKQSRHLGSLERKLHSTHMCLLTQSTVGFPLVTSKESSSIAQKMGVFSLTVKALMRFIGNAAAHLQH